MVFYLAPLPICKVFAACEPILLIKIKGIQIGDHGIKIISIADNIAILLGDISCRNRIQMTVKLYEDVSSSNINFSETKLYELEHLKMY